MSTSTPAHETWISYGTARASIAHLQPSTTRAARLPRLSTVVGVALLPAAIIATAIIEGLL